MAGFEVSTEGAKRSETLLMDLGPYLSSEDEIVRRLASGLAWIQKILGETEVEARLRRQEELRGTTALESFDTVSEGARRDRLEFFSSVEFAAGISWSCDAPRSLEAKARDIRDRLAEAVEQLPEKTAGAVHVAVESYDGPVVEEIRTERITRSLAGFKTSSDLRAVSLHLLKFETPPYEAWAVEETVTVTSFARGQGMTIEDHKASPYVLEKRHAWTY